MTFPPSAPSSARRGEPADLSSPPAGGPGPHVSRARALRDGRASAVRRIGLGTRIVWWLKRVGLGSFTLAMVGALGVALVLRHYERGLPSVEELRNYQPAQTTRVLARDGSLLGELYTERRTVVAIDQIPAVMKRAVLAAEDARFYEHAGLDYLGMLRALWVNVRSGSTRQGGSTITQQVVKNVLLTPERTFERKAREVLLARRLEQELSKDQILELYLNHIYLGHGRYGVEEAARYYFGKRIAEVTLAEAALIAGLAKGPSIYSPRVDLGRARARREQVLDQLADQGLATQEEVALARRTPITLAAEAEGLPELAPEVVDEVRRLLHSLVGDAAARGGYTVATTIDPALQSAARAALRRNLDEYAERHGLLAPLAAPGKKAAKGSKSSKGRRAPSPFQGVPKSEGHHVYWGVVTGADDGHGALRIRVGTVEGTIPLARARRYNPKSLPPSRFAESGALVRVSAVLDRGLGPDGLPREYRLELGPQGAMVVVDPHTRHILALVGSYEAVRSGLDRATNAHRQPGSSFKPLVFGYGIHHRALTAATMLGEPPPPPAASDGASVTDGAGLLRSGERAADPPLPPLLREALARSDNAAAVWALRRLGPRNVVEFAESLGIRSKLGADESLALGAYEVTPRELAGAFATFAAGGVYEQPVLVTSVVGPNGVALELPALPAPKRVMQEAEAYLLTDLLTSVVERGTARRARSLGRPIAGKTGTSNDARDAWFAGYSPDLVCVVWTGYDDGQPLGARESGATAALPAFVELMRAAHEGRPRRDFVAPTGLLRVRIDPRSGLLAPDDQVDGVDELFLEGSEPTELAPVTEPPDAGTEPGDAEAPVAEEPPTGEGPPSQGAGGGNPASSAPPMPEGAGAAVLEPSDAGPPSAP